jgi:hypothetical protein
MVYFTFFRISNRKLQLQKAPQTHDSIHILRTRLSQLEKQAQVVAVSDKTKSFSALSLQWEIIRISGRAGLG